MELISIVPETLEYIKYINSFCRDGLEAQQAASRKTVAGMVTGGALTKGKLIKDLLRTALDRRLSGAEEGAALDALRAEFIECGLNNEADFDEYLYFFKFYIQERQSELFGMDEQVLPVFQEFYENIELLSDSVYRVNMSLYFLHHVLSRQLVGRLPEQVTALLAYLDGYDLQDDELRRRLAEIFQLAVHAES